MQDLKLRDQGKIKVVGSPDFDQDRKREHEVKDSSK